MSRGLGRIQRECLRVIAQYEALGERLPNTCDIAAEIYQVHPDQDLSDAQQTATKRALASLRRKGLVASCRDLSITPWGAPTTRKLAAQFGVSVSTARRVLDRNGLDYGYAERCCLWSKA